MTDVYDWDGDGYYESADTDGDGFLDTFDTDYDGVYDATDWDGDGVADGTSPYGYGTSGSAYDANPYTPAELDQGYSYTDSSFIEPSRYADDASVISYNDASYL